MNDLLGVKWMLWLTIVNKRGVDRLFQIGGGAFKVGPVIKRLIAISLLNSFTLPILRAMQLHFLYEELLPIFFFPCKFQSVSSWSLPKNLWAWIGILWIVKRMSYLFSYLNILNLPIYLYSYNRAVLIDFQTFVLSVLNQNGSHWSVRYAALCPCQDGSGTGSWKFLGRSADIGL